MIIRHDFGEKLDLSKFQKQAAYYIGSGRRLTYHFFVKDFKIIADIFMSDESTTHGVDIFLYEIIRDKDGEISDVNSIYPHRNSKFQDITSLIELFPPDSSLAHFNSNNVTKTVEQLTSIIKLIHKINNLKIFL